MKNELRKTLFVLLLIMISACTPLSLPLVSTPVPTLAPGDLETIIAQTAAMAASQTAILITPSSTPTLTPSPTVTPSMTPSPTATFIFLLPTLASPSEEAGGEYACEVESVSPPYDSSVAAGQPFSARWEVKNTGTQLWDSNNIDFGYFSGAKIHKGPSLRDLDNSVGVGGILQINLKMNAPTKAGTYSTVWKLHFKDQFFCSMTIQIIVP